MTDVWSVCSFEGKVSSSSYDVGTHSNWSTHDHLSILRFQQVVCLFFADFFSITVDENECLLQRTERFAEVISRNALIYTEWDVCLVSAELKCLETYGRTCSRATVRIPRSTLTEMLNAIWGLTVERREPQKSLIDWWLWRPKGGIGATEMLEWFTKRCLMPTTQGFSPIPDWKTPSPCGTVVRRKIREWQRSKQSCRLAHRVCAYGRKIVFWALFDLATWVEGSTRFGKRLR